MSISSVLSLAALTLPQQLHSTPAALFHLYEACSSQCTQLLDPCSSLFRIHTSTASLSRPWYAIFDHALPGGSYGTARPCICTCDATSSSWVGNRGFHQILLLNSAIEHSEMYGGLPGARLPTQVASQRPPLLKRAAKRHNGLCFRVSNVDHRASFNFNQQQRCVHVSGVNRAQQAGAANDAPKEDAAPVSSISSIDSKPASEPRSAGPASADKLVLYKGRFMVPFRIMVRAKVFQFMAVAGLSTATGMLLYMVSDALNRFWTRVLFFRHMFRFIAFRSFSSSNCTLSHGLGQPLAPLGSAVGSLLASHSLSGVSCA